MTLAFDTLRASRVLRDAGMDERTAEAVVGVIRQTADLPSIDHLATKVDLEHLATKNDLERLRGDFSERLRTQGWALLGGMTAIVGVIVGVATAFIKLFP